ncbi:MAG: hypothetical protein C4339_03115 [Nitrososphaerota archaeon]
MRIFEVGVWRRDAPHDIMLAYVKAADQHEALEKIRSMLGVRAGRKRLGLVLIKGFSAKEWEEMGMKPALGKPEPALVSLIEENIRLRQVVQELRHALRKRSPARGSALGLEEEESLAALFRRELWARIRREPTLPELNELEMVLEDLKKRQVAYTEAREHVIKLAEQLEQRELAREIELPRSTKEASRTRFDVGDMVVHKRLGRAEVLAVWQDEEEGTVYWVGVYIKGLGAAIIEAAEHELEKA